MTTRLSSHTPPVPSRPCPAFPLSPDHLQVLDLLAHDQPVPDHLADAPAELEAWGWVMAGGELTGIGLAHVDGGKGKAGIHETRG